MQDTYLNTYYREIVETVNHELLLPIEKPVQERRVKKGYWPGKILQVRGELAASITSHYDQDSAVVGTNKVYAAIHQFGGPAGKNKSVDIPQRPYLMLGDRENAKILNGIKNYLQD